MFFTLFYCSHSCSVWLIIGHIVRIIHFHSRKFPLALVNYVHLVVPLPPEMKQMKQCLSKSIYRTTSNSLNKIMKTVCEIKWIAIKRIKVSNNSYTSVYFAEC